MGENEGVNAEMMQRLQSSFGTSSSSFLKQPLSMDQLTIPQFTPSQQMRASGTTTRVHHSYGVDGTRRAGIPIPPSHHPHQIPPISPYSHSHIPPSSSSSSSSSISSRTLHHQAGSPTPTHTRSLSQPSFFSLDSLPPLSPSPFRDSSTSISDSADVSMEDRDVTSHSHSHSLLPPSSPFSAARGSNNSNTPLPVPRKSHRRSNSDIPFGFSNVVLNSSPPLIPLRGAAAAAASNSSNPAQLIKKEDAEGSGEKKFSPEGEVVVDDLFSAYMNLDNINDALNNNSSDEKNGTENNDLDSRASGTKTNNTGGGDSSDNEAESSVNEQGGGGGGGGGGVKRSAGGDVVLSAGTPTSRHYRSVSMDSFIGKLSFSDHDSLPNKTMMPPSSPGSRPGLVSPPSSNGVDGNSSGFSLEFGNGEFSGSELKKIMANEKLAEIAMTDPKRAKRILANRQSAARSKERKMRYISELEHKVQTLQTEATTLSAQLTLLQRDSVGLTNQNSELKFRLQSMEQQAKLRDALNEALTAEVHRLKLATAELNSESHPSSCLVLQHSVNPLMFQQQPRKASQQNIHLQQQQQQLPQQQNGNGNSQTDLKQ